MTRYPRGTLLAVVGTKDVLVCVDCDSEVIPVVRRGSPIPEDYQPRFLIGQPDPAPHDQGSSSMARSAPGATVASRRRPSSSGRVAAPVPRSREVTPVTDPTVRQATAACLEGAPDADAVAVTLLGAVLGPATRLSSLSQDPERLGAELNGWIVRDLGRYKDDRRRATVEQVRAAFTFWSESGWFTADAIPALLVD